MGLGKRTLTLSLFLTIPLITSSFLFGGTASNVQTKSGWQSCTGSCAGGGNAPHSMTEWISTPSLSGHSAEYWLGGSKPYSNALWWKQLGGNSSVHHFVYDVRFYLKNSGAPQALEFDVNQTVGGHMYIFGTECDIKDHKQWRVWSASTGWMDTGIGCSVPSSYTWHHLTEEFYRTPTGKVQFISITLDGKKHYVNRTYAPKSKSGSEMNVAFQMDGNNHQTAYNLWLDNVTLNYW